MRGDKIEDGGGEWGSDAGVVDVSEVGGGEREERRGERGREGRWRGEKERERKREREREREHANSRAPQVVRESKRL